MKRLLKKYSSKMITIKDDYIDDGYPGWDAPASTPTRWLEGTIDINYIKDFPGKNGEVRKWYEYNGEKYFGNYSESEWNEFLEDIKQNGIKYPIFIGVEKDGQIYIYEGNHRIQACLQLGITEVPVEVRFFGNSQQHVTYFDE